MTVIVTCRFTRTRWLGPLRHSVIGLALVCSALLTAGCTLTVAGISEPARDSAGIIGIGRSIAQVLPTEAELSAVLHSPIKDDDFPPSVGGPRILSRWIPDEGAECAGVTHVFLRDVYKAGAVRAAANKHWSAVETRFGIDTAALALGSPRDAQALFAEFQERWQQCLGKAVVIRHKPDEVNIPDYLNNIIQVDASGPILTAVLTLSSSPDDHLPPFPSERALGVAYNCIIDVEVTDFSWQQGDPFTVSHAVDVVKKMTAKAGA